MFWFSTQSPSRLFQIGLLLSVLGCGSSGGGHDSSPPAPTPTPQITQVTVQINGPAALAAAAILASGLPTQIASVVLQVASPDCFGALIYMDTANITTGQTSVEFTLNLSSGPTACFIAKTYSQANGQGVLLYEGTASGIILTPGSITVPINLSLTGTLPPTATTDPAAAVTDVSATLNGRVNPNGYDTVAYFEWGTTTAYGNATPIQPIGAGAAEVVVSQSLSGLSLSTDYHYRIVAGNGGNIVYGADQQFTTASAMSQIGISITFPPLPPPTVTTDPAGAVTDTAATLNGTVNPEGTDASVYFEWGTTTGYGSTTAVQAIGNGTNSLPVQAALTGLASSTLYHFRVVAYNAGGLVMGADRNVTTLGGAWAPRAPMSAGRGKLAVGEINGILYAVGGIDNTGAAVATVEAYDPAMDAWTPKASMPTARWGLAAGVVNGLLYAVGGRDISGAAVATVEAYDPTMDSWTPKTSMPTVRGGVAVGVANGLLYAVGGLDNSPAVLSTVEAYDPAMDAWTPMASMPTARWGAVIGVINGLLYAAGGYDGFTPLSTVEAYDPAMDAWMPMSPMSAARILPGSGVINGAFYAAGGEDLNFSPIATMEAYDPLTDAWTSKLSMSTVRWVPGAGVVSGVLYVIGGCGTSACAAPLATVEAFTP